MSVASCLPPHHIGSPQVGVKTEHLKLTDSDGTYRSKMSIPTTNVPARKLPVVQPKPVPRGTASFETMRAALFDAFDSKVPRDYHLPRKLIENPPTDVSGIPASSGILSKDEIDITENHDAVSLVAALAKQQYTAVAVTTAFCKRAIIAHQLTCCLTSWFMNKAIEQAKELDDYMAKNGKPIGPLHGLPVSIKEHIAIRGTSSSHGYFGGIGMDDTDSEMVAILRTQGAVFYCKTNQPQSIMHLESDSHWGRTLNPFNIHLSSGGSTGGEAALIAMKGSVIGVGTDIGGSIRGPSAFCGIYGFKPTSNILPMRGFSRGTFPGELNVLAATGPMGRSLRDMDFFMRSILSARPHLANPELIPHPWGSIEAPLGRRFKIGIIDNDGFIMPQPPVKRALSWAKALISNPKYGDLVEIKDFKVFGAAEAWDKIRLMYWPDGGQLTTDAITSTGEPVHPLTKSICQTAEPLGMQAAGGISVMRHERDKFRHAFAKSWTEQDVDIVIGPAFVGPASAHDTAFYWTYTSLYNLVDYPGAVVPTPINAELGEEYDSNYVPLSGACQHVKELWEAGNFEGAPINLQIVARRYHDNELFRALNVLKDILDLA